MYEGKIGSFMIAAEFGENYNGYNIGGLHYNSVGCIGPE